MFISKVTIHNFRGFKDLDISLNELSIIIGENDSGKSNFFSALSLVLTSNELYFNQRRISVSDINSDRILEFYNAIISGETAEEILTKVPEVVITVQFASPKTEYEMALLKDWLVETPDGDFYELEYRFAPLDKSELISTVTKLLEGKENLEANMWFTLPIEDYEYKITSTNNTKSVPFSKLKRVAIDLISAERDDFSQGMSMKSNSLLTKMLSNSLSEEERGKINNAYINFFNQIESTDSFKSIINLAPEFDNFKSLIDEIECAPNFPNLKNILSNITLKYGDHFLYQRGLGARNLLLIILLFEYFYKSNQAYFSLCCIEEPEAHLSVNNLRLVIDFISKSTASGSSLTQTLINSHSPQVINKLDVSNVIVFSDHNRAIKLSTIDETLQIYLRKRPNFDILKLLFSNRTILVEGPTEEMLINACISKSNKTINDIEVISIGQKGFRCFLDIWIQVNGNNTPKKIGIVRDFDNQENAKRQHDAYADNHPNIYVASTQGYTLEDDLVSKDGNLQLIVSVFDDLDNGTTHEQASAFLKESKADNMLTLTDAIVREENPLEIKLPDHIDAILSALS